MWKIRELLYGFTPHKCSSQEFYGSCGGSAPWEKGIPDPQHSSLGLSQGISGIKEQTQVFNELGRTQRDIKDHSMVLPHCWQAEPRDQEFPKDRSRVFLVHLSHVQALSWDPSPHHSLLLSWDPSEFSFPALFRPRNPLLPGTSFPCPSHLDPSKRIFPTHLPFSPFAFPSPTGFLGMLVSGMN